MAREVVGTHPDVILVFSGPQALAFKAATTVIPIVALTADPVALGLVPSLADPGGNITGVASDAGLPLYERWIELLKELVPKLSSIYFLATQPHWEGLESSMAVRAGAKRAGTSLIPILLGSTFNEAAYESAFKSMGQMRFLSPSKVSISAIGPSWSDWLRNGDCPRCTPIAHSSRAAD
jgi:putative ABC transport system substrate-binding protein